MATNAMPTSPVVAKSSSGGPVTQTAQDVAGAAEALVVGAVQLARHTLTATVEAAEDVGGQIGALAVATVRGATKAAVDIGGDWVAWPKIRYTAHSRPRGRSEGSCPTPCRKRPRGRS